VDCGADPIGSLVQMFVTMVQGGRIARGQCPALRPVFLKPHGVAHGSFRVRPDLPSDLKVGLFAGTEYPAWVRFSSDTLPTIGDFKTTVGIGVKLFGAPVPKIFGAPQDTTFDLILQNFDVFFVDTAADMCAFTKAGVIDHDYDSYLKDHPEASTSRTGRRSGTSSRRRSTFPRRPPCRCRGATRKFLPPTATAWRSIRARAASAAPQRPAGRSITSTPAGSRTPWSRSARSAPMRPDG